MGYLFLALIGTAIALLGALYKNATLSQHNAAVAESVKVHACVIPGAIAGALIGGRLMHILGEHWGRAVFVLLMLPASYRRLTVAPSL